MWKIELMKKQKVIFVDVCVSKCGLKSKFMKMYKKKKQVKHDHRSSKRITINGKREKDDYGSPRWTSVDENVFGDDTK